MQLGLMFFASESPADGAPPYRVMIDAAVIADREGFACVWTPERHFDKFGGLFPNPAITSAALATVTQRIQLRAGSSIAPLHDVVRLAEDWSMVDNLSGGRVAISFGCGWNVNDFIFFPERYADRQAVMFRQMEDLRSIWRGAPLVRHNSVGQPVRITIHPSPVQRELPVWVTSSGSPRTFAAAGSAGANVLTHLLGQDRDALAEKIRIYRAARQEAGFAPETGVVSLMLHTYLAHNIADAKARARGPLHNYLRSAAELEKRAAQGGGTISGGHKLPAPSQGDDAEDITDELLSLTCDRYLDGGSLIGSVDSCATTIDDFSSIGVNEIACLVDFGLSRHDLLEGLRPLSELRKKVAAIGCSPMLAAEVRQ